MAWAVTAHADSDPVGSAALMLVLHDLRGAVYPYGRLDVDTLTAGQLAGFGGHESEIIDRARAIKSDALAHAATRAPLRLVVSVVASTPLEGVVNAAVTDGQGAPVAGVPVQLTTTQGTLDQAMGSVTGPDGTTSAGYQLPAGTTTPTTFSAMAGAPDPTLAVYASSTVVAQRIAIPSWLTLTASATLEQPAPSTTTTTTAPPTTRPPRTTTTSTSTTTRPGRTTTTSTTTSTTSPIRPTPTTVGPTTSVPVTSRAPATGPAPPPPGAASSVGAVGAIGTLPRTGSRTLAWLLVGIGLVLLGASLVSIGRSVDRPPAPRSGQGAS